ncbi:YraN family protein [Candidatus Saccharibacteria bacterium]|nr:YraN family protein [Candidatus Saccharibacteria bacterium]
MCPPPFICAGGGVKRSFIIRTTDQGLKAEKVVTDLLEQEGFEIIDRNWKTKVCEIDIIAQADKVIYFVEVKFRGGDTQGSGFEYVTVQKQRQMNFAARLWCQTYKWDNDYRLMAAAVSGLDCENIEIIELD